MTQRSFMVAGVASAALAACSPARPVVLTPPAHLLHCADAPAVPESLPPQGTIERGRATVKLWLDEREAGADCRGRLNAVREWWERVK